MLTDDDTPIEKCVDNGKSASLMVVHIRIRTACEWTSYTLTEDGISEAGI